MGAEAAKIPRQRRTLLGEFYSSLPEASLERVRRGRNEKSIVLTTTHEQQC